MTTDPPTDFDGCRRACRQAGAHTLVSGECEHAPQPEPTVSLSRVSTAADGHPTLAFDTYTVRQLAGLIEPAVRDAGMALAAAHAIVHRHDPHAAPPQGGLPPLLAAAQALELDRDAASSGESADYRRGMTRAVTLLRLLDEEEPAVLPPPTDRTAVRTVADALRSAACTGDCGDTEEECARHRVQPCVWRHGVLAEIAGSPEILAGVAVDTLRRMSAEPQPETQAAPPRSRVARLLDAVTHSGPGYDLTPTVADAPAAVQTDEEV